GDHRDLHSFPTRRSSDLTFFERCRPTRRKPKDSKTLPKGAASFAVNSMNSKPSVPMGFWAGIFRPFTKLFGAPTYMGMALHLTNGSDGQPAGSSHSSHPLR